MNNTNKAKVDAARRMLAGKIPVDEVFMLTGVDMEILKKIEEEVSAEVRQAKVLQGLDNKDINLAEFLIDNYETDESADSDY